MVHVLSGYFKGRWDGRNASRVHAMYSSCTSLVNRDTFRIGVDMGLAVLESLHPNLTLFFLSSPPPPNFTSTLVLFTQPTRDRV